MILFNDSYSLSFSFVQDNFSLALELTIEQRAMSRAQILLSNLELLVHISSH
jgi:hypothetical protein